MNDPLLLVDHIDHLVDLDTNEEKEIVLYCMTCDTEIGNLSRITPNEDYEP